MNKLRIAKKLVAEVWVNVPFKYIKKGDIIQLFDFDDFQVTDSFGNWCFLVKEDAFEEQKRGLWSVRVWPLISCKESNMKLKSRKTEILNPDDKTWIDGQFENLEKGDIFRMYEPDTKFPVVDSMNNHQFVARSNAYNKNGVWSIRAIPLMPIGE